MPMTMNQVIHAAVRRDLTRLDRALDAFPSEDAERANQLARAYRFLRHQLTDHHQSEDELVWPVIARLGVDRALLDAMESEHHEMSEALIETSAAMTALVARPETDMAAEALASVRRTRAVDHDQPVGGRRRRRRGAIGAEAMRERRPVREGLLVERGEPIVAAVTHQNQRRERRIVARVVKRPGLVDGQRRQRRFGPDRQMPIGMAAVQPLDEDTFRHG